jgi:hypothetical protein
VKVEPAASKKSRYSDLYVSSFQRLQERFRVETASGRPHRRGPTDALTRSARCYSTNETRPPRKPLLKAIRSPSTWCDQPPQKEPLASKRRTRKRPAHLLSNALPVEAHGVHDRRGGIYHRRLTHD